MAFPKKGFPPKKSSATAASAKTMPRPAARIGGAKGTTPMGDSTQPPMQQAFSKGGKVGAYAKGGQVASMGFGNASCGAKSYKK